MSEFTKSTEFAVYWAVAGLVSFVMMCRYVFHDFQTIYSDDADKARMRSEHAGNAFAVALSVAPIGGLLLPIAAVVAVLWYPAKWFFAAASWLLFPGPRKS